MQGFISVESCSQCIDETEHTYCMIQFGEREKMYMCVYVKKIVGIFTFLICRQILSALLWSNPEPHLKIPQRLPVSFRFSFLSKSQRLYNCLEGPMCSHQDHPFQGKHRYHWALEFSTLFPFFRFLFHLDFFPFSFRYHEKRIPALIMAN